MGPLCQRSEDAATDQFKAEARRYFASLDRRANANLGMVDPAMVAPINAVYGTLLARIRQRLQTSSGGTRCGVLPLHRSPTDVRRISVHMLGAMAERFGTPLRSPERIRRIGAAHDIFSWGGLFLRSTERLVERPNTTPDGAAIFMFPELAHLAIEMGIDAEDWTALLPTLTRMPAIYLRVHDLASSVFGPRPFGDYGRPPEFDVSETVLSAHAENIAAQYGGLSQPSLSDALSQLVKRAFTEV